MPDTITLKDDFIFLVSDNAGDLSQGMPATALEGHGMYLRDTRYLSRFELLIDGQKPQLLSRTNDYNVAATFRLSTPFEVQIHPPTSTSTPQAVTRTVTHMVAVARRRYIKRGLIESIEFTNYHTAPVHITASLRLGADFADIFE